MAITNNVKFDDCIATLSGGDNHRVWSLIVSFFGDLAQSERDHVSGTLLTRFGQLAGVKPEAMRVALHRLRCDGWIDSERNGRTSHYFLTLMGRAESTAASPRIYAAAEPFGKDWTILISRPGKRIADLIDGKGGAKAGFWFASENIAITSNARYFSDSQVLKMELTAVNLPDWLKGSLLDQDLIEACALLCKTLESIDLSEERSNSFTPLETATLRTLVVHSWRRVRLRQPDLPDWAFPDGWKGRECREHVARLLERLPRPDLPTLEAEV